MLSYILGCCLLVAMVVPPAWGAVRVRRRILPEFAGAPGLVVDLVLWAALIIVVPELLGAIGLFRRFVIAAALLGVGLLCGTVSGPAGGNPRVREASSAAASHPAASRATHDAAAPTRMETGVAVIIAGAFAFPWAAWLWANIRSGIFGYDSLGYHLPFPAQWVQTASTWHINLLGPETVVPYNPASAEVVHGLGMLAFHSALISPLVNLVWLALLAAAAWSIGRPYGRGPHCMALAVVAADCPLLLSTQPGSAMNDLTLVALALAAVAITVQGLPMRRVAVPLGLALGLEAGTKLDGLAFVAVMLVGALVLTPVGQRVAVGWRLVVAAALSGGFFYLRNAAAVGNPLPGLHSPIPQVKAPLDALLGASIAHYLSDGKIVRHVFLPGLHHAFGGLWPLWLLTALGGAVAILIWAPTGAHRTAAVGALATVAAWVVTPTSAAGPPGNPTLFIQNIRYGAVGFVLGAALLAVTPRLAGRRWGCILLGLAALLAVSSITPASAWPAAQNYAAKLGWRKTSIIEVIPLLVVAGLAWLWAWRRPAHRAKVLAAVTGIAVAGVAVGGYVVRSRYVPRYFTARISNLAPELAWSRVLHHQSIGTVGLEESFPLYNDDLSNRVAPVAVLGAQHEDSVPNSCAEFRKVVDARRYHYVAFSPDYVGQTLPSQDVWVRDASGAVLAFASGDATVYRIDHPLDPTACPR